MTPLLLKRPDKLILAIIIDTQHLDLISRMTVEIHTLRLSGPGSSKELIRSQLLTGKSLESPRTIIQKGTSIQADTSLKVETLQEVDQIALTTSVEGMVMVQAMDTETVVKPMIRAHISLE